MTDEQVRDLIKAHEDEIAQFQFAITEAVTMIEAGQVAEGVKLLRIMADCGPRPPERRKPSAVPDPGDGGTAA